IRRPVCARHQPRYCSTAAGTGCRSAAPATSEPSLPTPTSTKTTSPPTSAATPSPPPSSAAAPTWSPSPTCSAMLASTPLASTPTPVPPTANEPSISCHMTLIRPDGAITRIWSLPLVRRQAEALPDLQLDDLRRRPRVHGVDVLLAPENCQDGVGLVVIVPQPDCERLLAVIFPGDQLSAAHVAPAGDLRAVGDQVVVHPAVGAQPAVEDAAADLAVGQVKLDDAVDVVALQEELGLPRVPREPVDDEAEVPVVLGEPVPDHRLHQIVPDQFSCRHDPAHLRAQLGVVMHVPPEAVTHADVHHVQVRR